MSANKHLPQLQKFVQVAWGDLTVHQQAWELTKIALHGEPFDLSRIAMRAETIRQALISGELIVKEIQPGEDEIEMERRTR
jgi:hypothetical protein